MSEFQRLAASRVMHSWRVLTTSGANTGFRISASIFARSSGGALASSGTSVRVSETRVVTCTSHVPGFTIADAESTGPADDARTQKNAVRTGERRESLRRAPARDLEYPL